MSIASNISDLATRIATEIKAVKAQHTTDVTTLTGLVNALDAEVTALAANAGAINDASSATNETWSASKIATEIQAAKNALTNGAATALDTLAELAAAIGNDANFATTVTTGLGNRVRFDAAQTLTTPQKLQACANIGVGDPDTNYVTVFNAGLV